MVVIDVVVEDENGDPADVAAAARWQEAYGLTFTVLADEQADWVTAWGNSGSSRYTQHSYTVIGSDGIVQWHDEGWTGVTKDEIISAVLAAP